MCQSPVEGRVLKGIVSCCRREAARGGGEPRKELGGGTPERMFYTPHSVAGELYAPVAPPVSTPPHTAAPKRPSVSK